MALVTYRLEDGSIVEPRVAIGGSRINPRLLPEAEALLSGNLPEESVFLAAAKTAALAIDPMEDINNTADYRRRLVQTLLQRALKSAA